MIHSLNKPSTVRTHNWQQQQEEHRPKNGIWDYFWVQLPVFGSVCKCGPSKLWAIISDDCAIADTRIRPSSLGIKHEALGSKKGASPNLCFLELVLGVPYQIVHHMRRSWCQILWFEILLSSC